MLIYFFNCANYFHAFRLFQCNDDDVYINSDDELERQAEERSRDRVIATAVHADGTEEDAQFVDPEDLPPEVLSENQGLNIDGLLVNDEEADEVGRADQIIQSDVEKQMSSCVGQIVNDLKFILAEVNVSWYSDFVFITMSKFGRWICFQMKVINCRRYKIDMVCCFNHLLFYTPTSLYFITGILILLQIQTTYFDYFEWIIFQRLIQTAYCDQFEEIMDMFQTFFQRVK